MPIGLLVGIGLIGACTGAALWAPKRPLALARLTYFLGVSINEIPQYAALLLLASVALACASGDITSTAAAIIVGASTALVLAGLLSIGWRSRGARALVEAALREAGVHPRSAGRSSRAGWLIWLWPFPVRSRSIVRLRDLRYGPHARNRLDVYHRHDRPPGGPALLYLHGGGYFSGGKHREARALLHRLAMQGWVCASANYRLRPAAGFLEHLTDAKRALGWVHEHAADYGADGTHVVMAGSSAGAHLSALCALSPGDQRLQPGFEQADTSVAAVISLYAYYGRYYGRGPDEEVSSSPLVMDASGAPPFFVAHGTADNWVPVGDARRLAVKLREEAPSPPVYVEFPGAQHGFDLFRARRFEATLGGIDDFLAKLRRRVDADGAR